MKCCFNYFDQKLKLRPSPERGDMSPCRAETRTVRNFLSKVTTKEESDLEKYFCYQSFFTFRATTRACQICTAVIGYSDARSLQINKASFR